MEFCFACVLEPMSERICGGIVEAGLAAAKHDLVPPRVAPGLRSCRGIRQYDINNVIRVSVEERAFARLKQNLQHTHVPFSNGTR